MLLLGGLETRLFSYIEWLKSHGHELTFIVSRISKDIEIPEGIRIVQLRHLKFPKSTRQKWFNKALGRYMAKHQFDLSISLGRTSHQDIVLAPGNHLGYLRSMSLNINGLSDRIQIELDELAYGGSKKIYAASQMMRDELIQLYRVPAAKISVLYPPIDTARFHVELKKEKDSLRKKYGFAQEKFSLLFVSTGHRRKGLDLLINIMQSLDSEQFELIVSGSPIPPGLPKHIKYMGFVKDSQELFAAADCTIHPAKYEPYGQVVAESILCATPVIVSKMTGASEIVSEKEGLVVEGFDVEDWVKAILQVKASKYLFSNDFAERNALSLDQHMQQLIQLPE